MRKLKFTLFILLGLLANILISQEQTRTTLDTLYANSDKNVALFFPDPIRQGIVGTANFAFTYNREQSQYFGLLQGQPGPISNLLVLTHSGDIYSFILKYTKDIENHHYFIKPANRLGNEIPHQNEVQIQAIQTQKSVTPIENFKTLSEQLLRKTKDFNQIKWQKGISLKVAQSVYHSNEVYLVFEISNSSQIDYNLDLLELYKVSGNPKQKASHQALLQSPHYAHQLPKKVIAGNYLTFVMVYPKFTFGTGERLQVKLKESNGDRDFDFQLKFR